MKNIFILLLLFPGTKALFAQESQSMIGVSATYEYFKGMERWGDVKWQKGTSIGIENTEIRGRFGYRLGLMVSRLKTIKPHPYNFNTNSIFIDIWYAPFEAVLTNISFPVSGQLYIGKKNTKFYLNTGITGSLNFFDDESFSDFSKVENYTNSKSIGLGVIYGWGVLHQLNQRFALDIGFNIRQNIKSLGNPVLEPLESYGIHIKWSYIFSN